jgi:hypothetical protein
MQKAFDCIQPNVGKYTVLSHIKPPVFQLPMHSNKATLRPMKKGKLRCKNWSSGRWVIDLLAASENVTVIMIMTMMMMRKISRRMRRRRMKVGARRVMIRSRSRKEEDK